MCTADWFYIDLAIVKDMKISMKKIILTTEAAHLILRVGTNSRHVKGGLGSKCDVLDVRLGNGRVHR